VKRTPALVAPAVLLPLAAVAAVAHKLPASVATAIDAAPLLVFGSGALLGLLTRRARLVIGLVVLALADCALVNVGGRTVFDAVALLLPLNLAVVVWLGGENPFAGRGAALFAIILLQAAMVAVLQQVAPKNALDMAIVSPSLGMWTALPQLAVLAFAAALGLVVMRFLLHGHAMAAGAAWALVASFLALDGASAGGPASVHFATAGLLLVVGATWDPRTVIAKDPLTRLPTRIEFNRALHDLSKGYTVAYVEIDDFQNFRDTHGTDAAQRMLRLVGKRLRGVGGGGQAYYCQGPTFAVLFPGTPAKRAMQHLDVVRMAVEDLTVDVSVATKPASKTKTAKPGVVERTVSVTISAGVAEPGEAGEDTRHVLEAAEGALGRARQAGMNRVSR
jgi:diguanylate cyclase (GGDEF)-like protein